MAIKTRDELMTSLQSFLGDNTSDEALALVQDISDTLGDSNAQTVQELRQQIVDQDAAWRKRYRDTFFSGQPEPPEEKEPQKPRTFEELFTYS